jgi:hypothetical protein
MQPIHAADERYLERFCTQHQYRVVPGYPNQPMTTAESLGAIVEPSIRTLEA